MQSRKCLKRLLAINLPTQETWFSLDWSPGQKRGNCRPEMGGPGGGAGAPVSLRSFSKAAALISPSCTLPSCSSPSNLGPQAEGSCRTIGPVRRRSAGLDGGRRREEEKVSFAGRILSPSTEKFKTKNNLKPTSCLSGQVLLGLSFHSHAVVLDWQQGEHPPRMRDMEMEKAGVSHEAQNWAGDSHVRPGPGGQGQLQTENPERLGHTGRDLTGEDGLIFT